jgi:hypothetical protein
MQVIKFTLHLVITTSDLFNYVRFNQKLAPEQCFVHLAQYQSNQITQIPYRISKDQIEKAYLDGMKNITGVQISIKNVVIQKFLNSFQADSSTFVDLKLSKTVFDRNKQPQKLPLHPSLHHLPFHPFNYFYHFCYGPIQQEF